MHNINGNHGGDCHFINHNTQMIHRFIEKPISNLNPKQSFSWMYLPSTYSRGISITIHQSIQSFMYAITHGMMDDINDRSWHPITHAIMLMTMFIMTSIISCLVYKNKNIGMWNTIMMLHCQHGRHVNHGLTSCQNIACHCMSCPWA